jgi:hypothetical protein
MDRIEREAVIRTGARGAVFCESTRRRARAREEAERRFKLRPGRGRDYVEVEVPHDWVVTGVNPLTGREEWIIFRDIPLDVDATIVRRRS